MIHNSLYRLQRSQKTAIKSLSVIFILLSAFWFFLEFFNFKFPMEPIVVLSGGLATFFAVYWPFNPPCRDRRLKGHDYFDYTSNSGQFKIGRNDLEFTLKFTPADGQRIYIYNDPSNILSIALAQDAGKISAIKDATVFDYSNRFLCLKEGQIVCLKNKNENYACIQVVDIRHPDYGDDRHEVTFSYVINPDCGSDFS